MSQMSLPHMFCQDRTVRRARGGIQLVLRDGRSICQDLRGGRGEAEEDGSATGCCIAEDERVRSVKAKSLDLLSSRITSAILFKFRG